MGDDRLTELEILETGLKRDHPVFFNAMKYHRTHKGQRMDFINNPWAVDVYMDDSPFQVFIKSTQNGITEYELARDISEAAVEGRNVFHVLPNDQILQRYVHERFDKTVDNTPLYKSWLKAGGDSVHLKQMNKGTVAYVASGSTSQFTEFAADTVIIDEMDQCDQDNITMAPERLSYSSSPRQLWVSNPTIVGYGIDELFSTTDQMHWHIKCPGCGKEIEPDFFKHVVREVEQGSYMVIDPEWERPGQDARMFCDNCGHEWGKSEAGVWIPHNSGAIRRGRYLSKLFTARTTTGELVQHFFDAQTDDTKMTRFYNADLGLAFTAPGAKITEDMLNDCIRDYKQGQVPADGICIAGIDVGTLFHIAVGHMQGGVPGINLIDAQGVRTPEEVIDLIRKYKVRVFVIDAMPETRISRQIANRAGGFMCFFSQGKTDVVTENRITTDRTQSLDNVKAAVMEQALRLPANARSIPDYYAHMTASTRVFDQELHGGEGGYDWREGSKPDHLFLATAYMEMAARLLVMARQ